jgi:predicted protein tyrosine phosphatase
MFIQNCSREQIKSGNHADAGKNSMLIQIADPDTGFPTPVHEFREVHKFKFFDVEEDGADYQPCTDADAKKIFDLLLHAKENKMNVIVHCHMGLCRSGAVAEAGVVLGFDDTGKTRIPNLLLKKKLFTHIEQWMQK